MVKFEDVDLTYPYKYIKNIYMGGAILTENKLEKDRKTQEIPRLPFTSLSKITKLTLTNKIVCAIIFSAQLFEREGVVTARQIAKVLSC